MSTAILDIRVSTDEQALTGYSMRSQEDRLMKFCLSRNITILQSVCEGHSAKSFHSPAWTKLMKELSQNKSRRPDLLLFTR
jgi:site-specific DNA recombinase